MDQGISSHELKLDLGKYSWRSSTQPDLHTSQTWVYKIWLNDPRRKRGSQNHSLACVLVTIRVGRSAACQTVEKMAAVGSEASRQAKHGFTESGGLTGGLRTLAQKKNPQHHDVQKLKNRMKILYERKGEGRS